MASDCNCALETDGWMFDRISAAPRIAGGTTVEWTVHPNFQDPAPLAYQLQVGSTGNSNADDWEDVGEPVDDTFFLVDTEQRVFGKTQWTHYRVKLTTTEGTYYSAPIEPMGPLDFRHWRLAREMMRKERLMLRMESGQEGVLFKMRYTGEACTRCTDFQTQEIRDTYCPVCLGTGITLGYYPPVSPVYAALPPTRGDDKFDKGQARGMVNDISCDARMIAEPQLLRGDVWVAKKSDLRWKLDAIENIAEMQGVPLVCKVKLRLVPFSDPIYSLAMPTE